MLKSFYLQNTTYYIAGLAAVIFVLSYLFNFFYIIAVLLLVLLVLAILLDAILLFSQRNAVLAHRTTADRFSLGDENKVVLTIVNGFGFKVKLEIIDEIPVQFQQRNWLMKSHLDKNETQNIQYFLRPVQRGVYEFGNINVFVNGPLKLSKRRFIFKVAQTVSVYPSYIQMKRYQLLATSNHLQEAGMKRIRKLGHSMEFEQIKEYVRGDDYRTINWKATARKRDLMVNSFTDERSQQVYCVINKGRLMKMPFDGMTLLDYAINACLVLSNVVISKQDKAGLITFAEKPDTFIQADKNVIQMNLLMESLYSQQTSFLEADYESLYAVLRNRVSHRSLLILFTNFETLEGLERELPSLKMMAKYHLLLVVVFENTEVDKLINSVPVTVEEIYIKTIAGKYAYEKKMIVKELRKNGILSILTKPAQLTIDTLNKYLELKGRNQV